MRIKPNIIRTGTVVGRYIDEGITGTLAKKRPAFMQMIEGCKAEKI